jgi:hypothetical protein
MTMIVPTVITMIVPVSAIIATIAIATEPQHNPYTTVTPPRVSISTVIVGVVIVGITITIVPVTISMIVAIMPVTIFVTVSRVVISTIAPPIIIPSSVASISGEFHRIGNLLHSR